MYTICSFYQMINLNVRTYSLRPPNIKWDPWFYNCWLDFRDVCAVLVQKSVSFFLLLLRKSHIWRSPVWRQLHVVLCRSSSSMCIHCEHAWEVVVGGKMKPNQGILGIFLLVFSHGLAVMSLLFLLPPTLVSVPAEMIHTLSPSPQKTPSSPNPDTLTNTEQKAKSLTPQQDCPTCPLADLKTD